MMKKRKLLCVLLVLSLFCTGLSVTGVAAENSPSEIGVAAYSEIDGISILQKGTSGGGVMLERHALATLDLSQATYLVIKYYNPTGAGWPFYFQVQQDNVVKPPADGTNYKLYNEKFEETITESVRYSAVAPEVTCVGYIAVPASAYGTLSEIQALYITLPAAAEEQIGVTELHFAGVYYATVSELTATQDLITLTDFSAWTEEWFTGRETNAEGAQLAIVKKSKITCDFGDVRILEDMDTGYSADKTEYDAQMTAKVYGAVGGLTAEQCSSVSHSGNAVKLTVVEPKPDKPDPYAGFTFTAKNSVFKWNRWLNDDGEMQGITFFVSNPSDAPLSMGFEIDEFDPEQDITANPAGERWSVGLGGRIIYYDTITKKQFLHSASPTVNVPSGFTGWVRIPVKCFEKPAWCTWGNSVLDLVNVPQFTFSVHTGLNLGVSFIIDSVGVYYKDTAVGSIFDELDNTIAKNMGIEE
ncbi:MAG: hypothetical protein HFE36_03420 [Clostridia bacterium]|nr:hypothetical protein [Clostridia bacterium]